MRRMTWLYAALGFLLSGYYATWQIALLDRGFSVVQLASLLAVSNVLSMTIDIPASVWADRIGHKISVVFGLLLYSVGFVMPVAMAGPYGLVGTVIFVAVGDALIEGALDCWVADVQAKERGSVTSHGYMGLDQVQRLGMIAGALIVPGAISLLKLSQRGSWSLYAMVAGAIFVLAYMLPAGISQSTAAKSKPHLSELAGHLKSKTLLLLLGGAFFFGLSDGAIQTGFWPRIKELGLSAPILLGLIQASMSLSRVVGLSLWKRTQLVESSRLPSFALLGSSLFYWLFAACDSAAYSVILWMLRIVVVSAFFSAQRGLLQKLYSASAWRSTVASSVGTVTQIGTVVFVSSTGLLGSVVGASPKVIAFAGAGFAMLSSVGYFFASKSSRAG